MVLVVKVTFDAGSTGRVITLTVPKGAFGGIEKGRPADYLCRLGANRPVVLREDWDSNLLGVEMSTVKRIAKLEQESGRTSRLLEGYQ